jgi:hypothetical protein
MRAGVALAAEFLDAQEERLRDHVGAFQVRSGCDGGGDVAGPDFLAVAGFLAAQQPAADHHCGSGREG